METGQVNSWLGDQGGQSCNKIQRLEDDVGGAVAKRGFQLVAHLAGRGE